jgi:2-dehydro-3-deoxyphosphooctonate aldolase (KDO 8-P synthase)
MTAVRFRRDALFLIAGPCVLKTTRSTCASESISRGLAEHVPGGIIFKASFDKANRSNAGAFRGPGLDEGLAALDRVRTATGLPILTDVHLPDQCAAAGQVADVLQIPAFLSRQTDLLVAAGATGKPVNVKKGQWMHPEGMRGAVAKVRDGYREAGHTGDAEVAATGARYILRLWRSRSSTFAPCLGMREACDAPGDLRRDSQRAAAGSRRRRH